LGPHVPTRVHTPLSKLGGDAVKAPKAFAVTAAVKAAHCDAEV
jgi:hypothetical protein